MYSLNPFDVAVGWGRIHAFGCVALISVRMVWMTFAELSFARLGGVATQFQADVYTVASGKWWSFYILVCWLDCYFVLLVFSLMWCVVLASVGGGLSVGFGVVSFVGSLPLFSSLSVLVPGVLVWEFWLMLLLILVRAAWRAPAAVWRPLNTRSR